jgi:putative ABC transport system substrate-binding protein
VTLPPHLDAPACPSPAAFGPTAATRLHGASRDQDVRMRCETALSHTSPFTVVQSLVGQGFVSSLVQPGGNITGFAALEFALATKILELLKKIGPGIARVAVMFDPAQPAATGISAELETAAALLNVRLVRMPIRIAGEVKQAFERLAPTADAGLFVVTSTVTSLQRELIATTAARLRIPAIYQFRYFVESGGLASYGADDVDLSRRAASYADRILKGERPADLPVQLPTKFELVLNLKTAKAMGLALSPEMLALADEVIE